MTTWTDVVRFALWLTGFGIMELVTAWLDLSPANFEHALALAAMFTVICAVRETAAHRQQERPE